MQPPLLLLRLLPGYLWQKDIIIFYLNLYLSICLYVYPLTNPSRLCHIAEVVPILNNPITVSQLSIRPLYVKHERMKSTK